MVGAVAMFAAVSCAQELKQDNDVAYLRFAAVYRLFTDIGDFVQELQKLLEERE